MVRDILEVQLNNHDLSPKDLRARDLAKFISAIEEMVAHIVVRDFPDLHLDQNDVKLSLIDIKTGSIGTLFAPEYDTVVNKAYETAGKAIDTNQIHTLPRQSIKAIEHIISIARKYETETVFGFRNGDFRRIASLSGNTRITSETLTAEGETVLYGKLVAIGGENPPTAKIRLLNGQDLKCNVNERNELETARELGQRLYTEVGVRGMARWDLDDMSIVFFRIDEVLPYRGVSILEAIENSSQVFGNHLADIEDIEDLFTSIRNGGEGES